MLCCRHLLSELRLECRMGLRQLDKLCLRAGNFLVKLSFSITAARFGATQFCVCGQKLLNQCLVALGMHSGLFADGLLGVAVNLLKFSGKFAFPLRQRMEQFFNFQSKLADLLGQRVFALGPFVTQSPL
ncbi:hypothetical protein DP23_4109 [Ralstonia pickettii]|nr:hypothetical protein DP23_4109 [Ralstonia pickettii]